MAIQPIDLSVIYSQMDNVAKFNASQNQQAQAANQSMINKTAQDRLESSKTVKATENSTDTNTIKNDLRQGSSGGGALVQGKKKKSGEDSEDENQESSQYVISDPSLGQHIDITG
ncbi:MAG: hypothetical protein IKR40_06340 [Treponema sp.]|nr:hypothetical protein [Treponema sp.]